MFSPLKRSTHAAAQTIKPKVTMNVKRKDRIRQTIPVVTLVLDRGASGLRTGVLLGLPAAPPIGADLLLDAMLSRMFATRG